MEKICKNCRLFNDRDNVCSVVVMIKGEKFELNTLPTDECHWERADREIQAELNHAIKTSPDKYFKERLLEEKDVPIKISQMRAWSDGKNGFIESS